MAYRDEVIADAPVIYLRLGETSGTVANDETTNNLDGTYINSPTLGVAGAVSGNTAVTLNGTTQFISVSHATALNTGDVMSVEAFVKRSDLSQSVGIAYKHSAWGVAINASGNLVLLKDTGATSSVIATSTTTILDTNWHHVVLTKNGSTIKIYIDGVDRTGSVANQTLVNSTQALLIGFENVAEYFSGSLDEVAIYPTALSASRAQAHYNAATTTILDKAAPRNVGGTTLALRVLQKTALVNVGGAPAVLRYGMQWRVATVNVGASPTSTRFPAVEKRSIVNVGVSPRALGSVLRGEPLAQVIRRALTTSPVALRYRLFLSNASGERLQEIKGIEGATVDLSNFRDSTWGLGLTMRATDALDPFTDYVMPVCEVKLETGEWQDFPLGLYRFDLGRSMRHLEHMSTWNLTGYSREALLLKDMAVEGYSVAAGQGVLAEVRNVLAAQGVPALMINLPPSSEDKVLPEGMYFDPSQDAQGSYWLRIVNALLRAGGFSAIQTDAQGRFVAYKEGDALDSLPEVSYGTGGDFEPMVTGEIGDDYDDERFANRVVVYSADLQVTPPIYAVAENRDPNSKGSIQEVGPVLKEIRQQAITSAQEAQALADAELQRSSGYLRKLGISTLPDPRRGPGENYALDLIGKDATIDGRWQVVSWSLPLSDPPTKMDHSLSRLERV